jgi:hypothetical protein
MIAASKLANHAAVRIAGAVTVCALAGVALSGCGETKRALGLERVSPDEFVVVSQAPLTIPPDMQNLPQPSPGARRPQDGSQTDRAEAAVFGRNAKPVKGAKATNGGGAGSGASALLAEAGRKGVDPNIRRKVDQETTQMAINDKSWVDTLLFWRTAEPSFSVIDPKKESQRLKQAEAEGKPVAQGVVPTIERKRKAPLEGLF